MTNEQLRKEFNELFSDYKNGSNSVGIEYIDVPKSLVINWFLSKREENEKENAAKRKEERGNGGNN
jgi:hypothetical protein